MKTTTHDLTRLSQVQIAWLIGQPTHWVRSNPHKVPRNPDGSYNAADVVQQLMRDVEVISPELATLSISELLEQRYPQKRKGQR